MEFVFVIFPRERPDRHREVEAMLSEIGIPSQILYLKNLYDQSILKKIALKINCKMGGELWAVNIPTKTMMVCGVDVYHDPTRRGQSVVGFVASVNPGMTRWYSRAKYQIPETELSQNLRICLVECLHKYYEVINFLFSFF